MIVNPQAFNYKLVIGSLIIAMVCLGIFGFSTYESTKAEQRFLEQEKKLVEGELSQMILRYDELSLHSNIMSLELDSAKKYARTTLEKLRLMHSDVSVLKEFKSELALMKTKNYFLFNTVDSINNANDHLKEQTSGIQKELVQQKSINHSLLKLNASLNTTLKKASLLTAHSFSARAYKSADYGTETSKAAHTRQIGVCFTLAENILTEKGTKDLYIQILNPLNNVVGAKGSVEFGDSLLIFSDKQVIHYKNQNLDVCTTIQATNNDKPFAKGTYYVSVFLKDRKLGDTQLVLN